MKYNKEYIEQLLQRFMDGETTEQEEQFLAEYFSKSDSIPEEWEAYREMFASFATDAYDFTQEELSTFVKEEEQKLRNIKMWPWLAAACVAALIVVFLAPPRSVTPLEDGNAAIAEVKKDSSYKDMEPQHPKSIITPNQKIAHVTESKTSSTQKGNSTKPANARKSITTSQETIRQEPNELIEKDLAMADKPTDVNVQGTSEITEDWDESIEQEFHTNSAPIRMRGQQVIQRVAMMQAAHRNQIQHVEL